MQLSSMAIAGQVLLWLGFLGGSFAAVRNLENDEAPWQSIPWVMYGGSALVGVVGVVCLRKDKADQRSKSAASETGIDSVRELLSQSAGKVAELRSNLSNMTCEEVLEYIDEQCGPLLAEFADGRMVISNRFGSATFAAVMTEFASGERYLNRAWSAAADGYVDEVEASVKNADIFMAAAVQELSAAENAA